MVHSQRQTTIDRRKVGALSRALRRRSLTSRERDMIGELATSLTVADGPAGLVKTVRYNLRVIETQVRHVMVRADHSRFDERSLASLPEAVQRRVIDRLANVEVRLEKPAARRRIRAYSTRTFRCLQDYETCRARGDAAGYWCAMGLLVCLAGQIAGAIGSAKSES